MNAGAGGMLERLAVAGLEKCAAKLSRVSAGAWRIDGAGISWGTLEDAIRRHSFNDAPASAVYFDIKGDFPFAAMIIFDPRDMDCIAKGFLGRAFPKTQALPQSGELLLSELGNIILNSLVGSLCNALKTSLVPSAPKCVHGEAQYLLEAFGTGMDLKRNFRIITVALSLSCGGSAARSEVIGAIPAEMEAEMEKIFRGET